MSLTALLMSMCLHTDLACEEIEIVYAPLEVKTSPRDVWGNFGLLIKGRATLFADGRQRIEINEKMRTWAEWQQRDVVMHELAHLALWHKHPNERFSAHGRQFRHTCYDIARAISVPTKRCKRQF